MNDLLDIVVLGAFIYFIIFILSGYHRTKYEERKNKKK